MRILLVSQDNSRQLQVGGKHIHQNGLVAAWEANGHDVRCCFPSEARPRLPLSVRILYRLTRRFANSPALYFAKYLRFLRESLKSSLGPLLAEWEPDVISVQDPMAAVACAEILDELQFSKRPPITMTLHGYYTWEMFNYGYYGDRSRNAIEAIGFSLEREALARVSGVITVDSRIRDYLRSQFGYLRPLHVVYNAINLAPFANAPCRNGMAPNTWRVLITRRMVIKNGVIVAVDALAEVLRRGGNVRLVMVGDGPELENVRRRARTLGVESAIDFVGAVNHHEVAKYYLQADILLMPSIPSDGIEEATSLSMLEGMAAGNLVICSAIGGMKEIVRHGENGFLIPPGDAHALAAEILALTETDEESRRGVIERAKRYVRQNHAAEQHAERILSLMVNA